MINTDSDGVHFNDIRIGSIFTFVGGTGAPYKKVTRTASRSVDSTSLRAFGMTFQESPYVRVFTPASNVKGRSEKQKRSAQVWQTLGTIARTQANLRQFARNPLLNGMQQKDMVRAVATLAWLAGQMKSPTVASKTARNTSATLKDTPV